MTDIVSGLVAKGDRELGIIPITQVVTSNSPDRFPPEIQIYTVFEGAVSANSKAADAARALIKFLTGPAAIPVVKVQGTEPDQ